MVHQGYRSRLFYDYRDACLLDTGDEAMDKQTKKKTEKPSPHGTMKTVGIGETDISPIPFFILAHTFEKGKSSSCDSEDFVKPGALFRLAAFLLMLPQELDEFARAGAGKRALRQFFLLNAAE